MRGSGGSSGTESHGNESHGNESVGSSSGNGKDSALTESSGSNKSSNSHSLSPPSSSNAFSLVSSEQDNPSTSGCSSEQSARAKTQKELFKTLKELKTHLPSEKRSKGKPSTVNSLKYALRCVKQVKANEEYYQMLMTKDSQPPGFDVSSYTIEEINSITSEYTLKNNDIFAVAVSLITGKIVYISDQAASILNCKREVFNNAKFVEFLAPQDVSVFYSFTTPYRLPSWSMYTGAGSSNTSKYLNTLEHHPKARDKMGGGGDSEGSQSQTKGSSRGDGERLLKYVRQEPLWLLMANADEKVMMTYQMLSRDIQRVLREDKERLRQMQKSQPHFTSDQRRELVEEHPWMRRGGLPVAVNVKECVYCEDAAAAPIEENLSHMEMGGLGEELRHEGPNAQSQSEKSQPQTDASS